MERGEWRSRFPKCPKFAERPKFTKWELRALLAKVKLASDENGPHRDAHSLDTKRRIEAAALAVLPSVLVIWGGWARRSW